MLSGNPCAASEAVQGIPVYGGSIMTENKKFGNDPAAQRRRMFTVTAAALCILCVCLVLTVWAKGHPGSEVPAAYGTILSLLPAVIAIALSLITKEVYSSLFVGIVVGAMLYSGGDFEKALNAMLYHESAGLVTNLTDISHASVLVFVTLLGTMVVLMNQSGGAEAFGKWASIHIKSRAGAELATIVMGLLIFVDDGFNCMTVGSVMRPLTDQHKVSRAKLAYLLDATAAPVCIIAPVSCWAAAVSYAVPEQYNINGFSMFLRTIPYNLYALGTIVMLLAMVLLRVDYGPMRKHEENALKGDLFTSGEKQYEEEKHHTNGEARLSNLVIPVVSLILLCIVGIAYTGGAFSGAGLVNSFADADSARGLVMGSLIALLLTLWLYMSRGVMTFRDFMGSFAAGFRSMCAPMIILILSWSLGGVCRQMIGTGELISGFVTQANISFKVLPLMIFVIAAFMSFSMGTSWGTFGILIPIVSMICQATGGADMLIPALGATLAGSVYGDHCSPISDTTILSSTGAMCDHIMHVETQIPYATLVAAVCAIGYLIIGFTGMPWIGFFAGFIILLGILLMLNKKTEIRQ